jgi:hypothetical protein
MIVKIQFYLRLRAKAFEMATKWINANYKLFMSECCEPMYEKLSTEGKQVAGTEYADQTGFGWTNGAILDLLVRYRDTIKYTDEITPPKDCKCKPKRLKTHEPFPLDDPKKSKDPNNSENPKKSDDQKKQEKEVQ